MSDGTFFVKYWCGRKEDPTGQQFIRKIQGQFLGVSSVELEEITRTQGFQDDVVSLMHDFCDEDGMVLSSYCVSTDENYGAE